MVMPGSAAAGDVANGLKRKDRSLALNASAVFFLVSVACAVTVCVVTFLDVVCVPPVGTYLTANIFELSSYVSELNDQFGRWLPQMMMEPTGSNMAFLLGVAAPALAVLVALALMGIAGFVVYVVLCWRKKPMAARIVGIASFAISALYPVALLAGQLIVGYEFSAGPFPPVSILTLEPAAYVWLVASFVGIVGVVFACRKTDESERREK